MEIRVLQGPRVTLEQLAPQDRRVTQVLGDCREIVALLELLVQLALLVTQVLLVDLVLQGVQALRVTLVLQGL